jgi:hypothetical protein
VLMEATISFMVPRSERTPERAEAAKELREHNAKVSAREYAKRAKEQDDAWRQRQGYPLSNNLQLDASYLPLDAKKKDLVEFERTLLDIPVAASIITELNGQLTGGAPHLKKEVFNIFAGLGMEQYYDSFDREGERVKELNQMRLRITNARFVAPSDLAGESSSATFMICRALAIKGRASTADSLMQMMVTQPILVCRTVFEYAAPRTSGTDDDPLQQFANLAMKEISAVSNCTTAHFLECATCIHTPACSV